MQSLRIKFGERRTDWQCCFCCHVRTGTIFLGLYHFVVNMLTLSALAVVFRYPEYTLLDDEMHHPMPTPLSEVDDDDFPKIRIESAHGEYIRPQAPLPHSYRTVLPLTPKDWNISMFFTMCTLVLTVLLLYGAIKRKPSYLMPFFGFQVFNFCVTSMATIGYLCYPPNFNQVLEDNDYVPFREELMHVKPQTLSLYVVLALLLAMMIKAYFIGVVWSCYKFLTLRQVANQRTLHLIDPVNQNLIRVQPSTADLPDYETAVEKFPAPPPSYATAVLGEAPAPPPTAAVVVRTTAATPAAVQQV